VQRLGTWYSYKDAAKGEIRLGQGRDKAVDFLRENAELRTTIDADVRKRCTAGASVAAGSGGGEGSGQD
jgi:recombination protein RecA